MTFQMHAPHNHKFSKISFYIFLQAFTTKLQLHSPQPTGEEPVFPATIITFFTF